jgi:hypothetical protein
MDVIISLNFHKHQFMVGSWDFVIQELWIGYTRTGIVVCEFVVKEVYVRYRYLLRVYDK